MSSGKPGLLIGLVMIQLFIIAGMLVKAMLPLYIGREIKVQVAGRDPRDLFRGSYVQLNYAFSQIDLDSLPNDIPSDAQYHYGDVFYLEMKPTGNAWEPAGLWQSPPENGQVFLTGRLSWHYYSGRMVNLNYGIESYFTDSKQARVIEERLWEIGRTRSADSLITVSLMVAPYGEARIRQINFPDNLKL